MPAQSPPLPCGNGDGTAVGDAGYTAYPLAAGLTVETDTPLWAADFVGQSGLVHAPRRLARCRVLINERDILPGLRAAGVSEATKGERTMKRIVLILTAIALLATAPGWAETTRSLTLTSKYKYGSDDILYLRGTWDRLVFTWLAPDEDGTFTLNLQSGYPAPGESLTYSVPTTTVVDADGTAVDVTMTVLDRFDPSAPNDGYDQDRVEFEVQKGVEYTITLQFPTSPGFVMVTWNLEPDDEHDYLEGGPGRDHLDGGKGSDILKGHGGDDTLTGGADDDWLIGGPDDDYLDGGKGSDLLQGGRGDDELFGGRGHDRMMGGSGDDVLKGGRGNDRLVGGSYSSGGGNDTLTGGPGKDRFFFGPLKDDDGYYASWDDGHKIITDFERGDRIILLLREEEEWPSSVADIIASIVAEGTRHVYTLAPGLTVETDVPLRSKDFDFAVTQ